MKRRSSSMGGRKGRDGPERGSVGVACGYTLYKGTVPSRQEYLSTGIRCGAGASWSCSVECEGEELRKDKKLLNGRRGGGGSCQPKQREVHRPGVAMVVVVVDIQSGPHFRFMGDLRSEWDRDGVG